MASELKINVNRRTANAASPLFAGHYTAHCIDDITRVYWRSEQSYSTTNDPESVQRNDEISDAQTTTISLLATTTSTELRHILAKMEVLSCEAFGDLEDQNSDPTNALALSILNDLQIMVRAASAD